MVDHAAAAELKSILVGIDLPAEQTSLLEYAVQRHAEPALLAALRSLPDREYESLDEVAESLVHVQPSPLERRPRPREESGAPPGGDDYTNPSPESGRVRDIDAVE